MFENTTGCRACGSADRVEILAFGDMPLSDGMLTEAQLRGGTEKKYPLTVLFCQSCSLVHIRETVEPSILFGDDYPYYSSFSDSWLRHCRNNALELIESRRLGADSLVVEIASNDGYMLRNFVEAGIPALGIDPVSGPGAKARAAGINVIEEFFTRELGERLAAEGTRADVVLGNNVLAHVADLPGFVTGIGALLKDDGVAVIECPYVRDLIEQNQFDTIYHEHLCYFSVTSVSRLFARHGLTLADVRRLPTHGGSLRLFISKRPEQSAAVLALLEEERQLKLDTAGYYVDFATRVRGIQRDLKALLGSLKGEGKTIAGYAAAAKGTIMLNAAGIDTSLVDYIVDRNDYKQGKYMPGVHIPICDTSRLTETPPDYLLVLAWNLRDEIMRQQQAFSDGGGKFIVPIPTPQVA
jgi:SAM-dependent methyltransferase